MYDAGVPQSQVSVIVSAAARDPLGLRPDGHRGRGGLGAHRRAARRDPGGPRRRPRHPGARRRRRARVGPPADPRGRQAVRTLDRPGGRGRQLLPRPGRRLRACRRPADAGWSSTPPRPARRPSAFGQFLRDELAAAGPREARPSAASGTRSAPATSSAPRSTSTRPTPGASRSSAASRPRWPGSRTRSSPAATSTTRSRRSTPTRPATIEGKEAFRGLDAGARRQGASAELDGTHFDIPEQVRRIECCIAPTSDGGDLLHRPERGLLPAGPDVVGGAGRHHRPSPPGARSPRSTTRACPAITCRSRRPPSAPSCSTAGSGCSAGSPATARAGRSTPSG